MSTDGCFNLAKKLEQENTDLRRMVSTLETALSMCASLAGNPDPAEGCRLIIATVQRSMPSPDFIPGK